MAKFDYQKDVGIVIGVVGFPKSDKGYFNYTVQIPNRNSEKVCSMGMNCLSFIGKAQFQIGDFIEFAIDKNNMLIMATLAGIPSDKHPEIHHTAELIDGGVL